MFIRKKYNFVFNFTIYNIVSTNLETFWDRGWPRRAAPNSIAEFPRETTFENDGVINRVRDSRGLIGVSDERQLIECQENPLGRY